MKNTIKLFGIIAFVAVMGFSMASCDDADDDDLNGTWVSSDGSTSMVLNNGNITELWDNVEALRGRYTTSGSNITITFTEINSAALEGEDIGLSPNRWYTEAQLREAVIQALVSEGKSQEEAEAMFNENIRDGFFGALTGTISGNTLTVTMGDEPTTFTRQN